MNIPALIADLEAVPVYEWNEQRILEETNGAVICELFHACDDHGPIARISLHDGSVEVNTLYGFEAYDKIPFVDWAIACLAVYRKHMGDAG